MAPFSSSHPVLRAWLWLALLPLFSNLAQAQETVCAKVKIEIKQELTLERQAFDATMKINNTTDTSVIDNVGIVVKVTDENGTPVTISDNPNDLSAKFFIRLTSKQAIDDIAGNGKVNPKTSAIIDWLLIPAPGSAGTSPLGKKYLIGATLNYRYAGENVVLNVSPDVITVKPLPLLTLDYFLPQEVQADDPITPEIEPIVPFTLGVRVKNTGFAAAKNLKIDSAQPKIIENRQGLLIGFKLTGSFLNDAPAQNTLLLPFGDVLANSSKMGRWIMETTLSGRFTEFTAKFTHSDELGGALTSLLQAVNAHALIRDVRVDLPGRDNVRDFLAKDGDVLRVYESDSADTEVLDRSSVANYSADGSNGYRLSFPATAGFAYVKLPDPFNGARALARVLRSDAKQLSPENAWLSQSRNANTKKLEYFVNFFDVNTSGIYSSEFKPPSTDPKPPVWQFIPDRVVKEAKPVSFIVEVTSPDGKPLTLNATPLPLGATFAQQAVDPQTPNIVRAVFDWTPAVGKAGLYPITYSASDGNLSAAISASIKVEANTPPPGPGTPSIDSPAPGAQVASLKPALAVQTSSNEQDPTTKVEFELYSDEAMTALVDSSVQNKISGAATVWNVSKTLNDNTRYWWRARATDGTVFSAWANGRFFVNLFNDPPNSFNLTSPAPNAAVDSLTPQLSWTNSVDKDGDIITYSVLLYKDIGLTQLVTQVADLPENSSGSTAWTVNLPLVNHAKYYWRVVAKDALGAQTPTPARPFVVNAGNSAPGTPVIRSPLAGSQSTSANTALTIQNSTDANNDTLRYVFEIDTVNTFDSSDKRSSGPVPQTNGETTSWLASNLVENKHYWWRVKAQDGSAESAWVGADFVLNAVNEAPPAPTVRNPGNGAWSATLQPTLEANPVQDPDGDTVHYQFQVFSDAALTKLVQSGSTVNNGTSWQVAQPLADKTTYYWRVRALDALELASDWSNAAQLHVSTGAYQDPTIAFMLPSKVAAPVISTDSGGTHKLVRIEWEGTDPNIEANIALYYSTSKTGFDGTLIIDGLSQSAGTVKGAYMWDAALVPPGAYYVYGVISDGRGSGKAYAAGAVVIPTAQQLGRIVADASGVLTTAETGKSASFNLRLGSAPSADVVIPLASSNVREGVVTPASVTFTPQNWSANQLVTVKGQNDCAPDGDQAYQVLSGKATSLDPNYIDASGTAVNLVNQDNGDLTGTTNNQNLHICGMVIVSVSQVDATTYDYVLRPELTNTGPTVAGVEARLTTVPAGVSLIQNSVNFGALAQGEHAKTNGTVTLRAGGNLSRGFFLLGSNFKWTVVAR